MPTPKEVAEWMVTQVESAPYVYQETLVVQIRSRFGGEFVYMNENGNPAIGKDVLRQFRKLTEGKVVWERSDRSWRKIHPNEAYKGRQVE